MARVKAGTEFSNGGKNYKVISQKGPKHTVLFDKSTEDIQTYNDNDDLGYADEDIAIAAMTGGGPPATAPITGAVTAAGTEVTIGGGPADVAYTVEITGDELAIPIAAPVSPGSTADSIASTLASALALDAFVNTAVAAAGVITIDPAITNLAINVS